MKLENYVPHMLVKTSIEQFYQWMTKTLVMKILDIFLNINYKTFLSILVICGIQKVGISQFIIPSEKPNIILIMADDMGYECIGANGNIEYQTPNLDRLAASGIRFENCYSQPLCTPSRVKIMTGKYNFRNYEDFEYLNPNQQTFGNLLKKAGYVTCIAGKWQLNGMNRNKPGNQDLTRPNHFGFDEYCLWQLHHKTAEGERYANPLLTQNGSDLPRNKDSYGPHVIADFISGFIDKNSDKPFFVYYPMVLPHDPFVPTPDSHAWGDTSRRYEKNTLYFADMIGYIDKIVGQIESKLWEKGILENTLVIFTADNGTHPSIVSKTLNGNVKGAKGQSLNTGNHVPLIVSWPEMIRKGRVVDCMVDFADFFPTLAEVAGINLSEYPIDGESFFNILQGDKNRRNKKEIFIHYSPRWSKFQHSRWVMNEKYKLYRDGSFYNTIDDPLERNLLENTSGKEAKIRKKFDAVLYHKELEIPFDLNNSDFKVGN
jgi:arylsulfatase A